MFLIHSITTTHPFTCNLHDLSPLIVLSKQYNSQRSLSCKILKQSTHSSCIYTTPSPNSDACYVLPSSNKLCTLELHKITDTTVSCILNSSIYSQFLSTASLANLPVYTFTLTMCYSLHSCQTMKPVRYQHI